MQDSGNVGKIPGVTRFGAGVPAERFLTGVVVSRAVLRQSKFLEGGAVGGVGLGDPLPLPCRLFVHSGPGEHRCQAFPQSRVFGVLVEHALQNASRLAGVTSLLRDLPQVCGGPGVARRGVQRRLKLPDRVVYPPGAGQNGAEIVPGGVVVGIDLQQLPERFLRVVEVVHALLNDTEVVECVGPSRAAATGGLVAFPGLRIPAKGLIAVAQVVVESRMVAVVFEAVLVGGDRLLVPPLGVVERPEVVVGNRERRVRRRGAFVGCDRLVVVPEVLVDVPEVVQDLGVRSVALDRPLHHFQRLFRLAGLSVDDGEIVQCLGVPGFQGDRMLELLDRRGVAFLASIDRAEQNVTGRQVGKRRQQLGGQAFRNLVVVHAKGVHRPVQ